MGMTPSTSLGECTYRGTYHRTDPLRRQRVFTGFGYSDPSCADMQCSRRTIARFVGRTRVESPTSERSAGALGPVTFERTPFRKMRSVEIEVRELDKLLYSIAEAALLLSCSRNTVYNLIKSGEILAVYPTSKARISAISLKRYVRKKESESVAERQALKQMVR